MRAMDVRRRGIDEETGEAQGDLRTCLHRHSGATCERRTRNPDIGLHHFPCLEIPGSRPLASPRNDGGESRVRTARKPNALRTPHRAAALESADRRTAARNGLMKLDQD